MKFKLTASILVTTLALSTSFSLTSKVQAGPPLGNSQSNENPVNSSVQVDPLTGPDSSVQVEPSGEEVSTKFSCVAKNDGSVATVGQRPDIDPIPLIVWTQKGSKDFGGKYSPQARCNIVTLKLNQAVADSGGSLQNVVLMTGEVAKSSVICVISGMETSCNSQNILFTLKPENANRADEILAQLVQIGRECSSAGVVQETRGRVQINLGKWEKLKIKTAARKPVTAINSRQKKNPVQKKNPAVKINPRGL